MAAQISPIEGINFFMPIFAFLFVFVLVYALLMKTKILGESKGVNLMISFLMAIFFVVNASLVDFVRFNSAWFAVFIVSIFFILLLTAFTHGDKLEFFRKPWVAWVIVIGIVIFFIVSSSYVFNWAINIDAIGNYFDYQWLGFILLLIIALVASWILTRK
jgi:hypothetical protein